MKIIEIEEKDDEQTRVTGSNFVMPKVDIPEKIKSFPYWYHKIQLGEYTTPGWAPLDRDLYKIPLDMSGKRVLDIGSWDGYWAFLALERGAKEVVAIDDFSDYLGHLDSRTAWDTFEFCRDTLGYTKEQCKNITFDIEHGDFSILGKFDVIFFFGTIYHLKCPSLALRNIASIANPGCSLHVESAICDDYSPYTKGNRGHGNNMIMEFYPSKEYGNNDSNWWCPTLRCLKAMVFSAGFSVETDAWKLLKDKDPIDSLTKCRGFVTGIKQ
jgi:tRNA (mo5U34)-methyltransferase